MINSTATRRPAALTEGNVIVAYPDTDYPERLGERGRWTVAHKPVVTEIGKVVVDYIDGAGLEGVFALAPDIDVTIEADENDRRAAYIEGLRAFADLLEQHPLLPLPYTGQPGTNTARGLHLVAGTGNTAPAELLAGLLGRPAAADVRHDGELWVAWHIGGLAVLLCAGKCEQTVTGVRIIDGREVPVTEALIPERFRPLPAELKAEAV